MDTPDLFPVQESLSPRLRWMRENAVRTHYSNAFPEAEDWLPWCAWMPDNDAVLPANDNRPEINTSMPDNPDACGYGKTEQEAVEELAELVGVINWGDSQKGQLV